MQCGYCCFRSFQKETDGTILSFQIQGNIHPHAIIILPNTNGMELLLSYEDEGVYIDTYGHFTKENVLQWGEMPASVGEFCWGMVL